MTRKNSNRTTSEIKAMMAGDDDFLRPIVRTVIQEFLEAEMTEAIGAQKGERVEGRSGYRSGYYPRSLITRVGKLELRVPQDRSGRFSTEIFERYQRSEKALVAALTEMYIQGVSTRKVKAISEELCGHSFSASAISGFNKKLDEELGRFTRRQLDSEYPYLILDARYEKVAGDLSSITCPSTLCDSGFFPLPYICPFKSPRKASNPFVGYPRPDPLNKAVPRSILGPRMGRYFKRGEIPTSSATCFLPRNRNMAGG